VIIVADDPSATELARVVGDEFVASPAPHTAGFDLWFPAFAEFAVCLVVPATRGWRAVAAVPGHAASVAGKCHGVSHCCVKSMMCSVPKWTSSA
jgi:hypothetical protein